MHAWLHLKYLNIFKHFWYKLKDVKLLKKKAILNHISSLTIWKAETWPGVYLADLSLTPLLLPAPWLLQLWEDRGAIISGSNSTKAGTQCSHFIISLWWADPSQLKGHAVMTELYDDDAPNNSTPTTSHASAHTDTHKESYLPLNLLSSSLTKTVITLGFSCGLSENHCQRS